MSVHLRSDMSVPTKEEISLTGGRNLDEASAFDHFFGKTQREAEDLFFENALYYEADLKWMGGKAIAFYFPALEKYLLSDESTGDSDIINGMISTLRLRFEDEPASLIECRVSVLRMLNHCLENYAKFQVDPSIYGELDTGLRRLIEQVQRLPD